jgi:hypothetical protein
MAIIAYGQLIAENARNLAIPPQIISPIFHLLVGDLTAAALALASSGHLSAPGRLLIRRMVEIPRTAPADWDCLLAGLTALATSVPSPILR